LVVLQVEEQERILKQIEEEYLEVLEQAKARGENKIEAQVLELDARAVEDVEHMEVVDESGSPFARSVRAVRYDVKRLVKPMKLEEVAAEIRAGVDATSDDQVPFKSRQAMRALAVDIGTARTEELARLEARAEQLRGQIGAAMVLVQAAKDKLAEFKTGKEEGYNDAAAALLKAQARLDSINEEAHLTEERKLLAESMAARIHSFLLEYGPGTVVSLTPSQDGELGEVQIGQVVSIKRLGKTKSPLSQSDYVMRIATTEASAPVAFRFTQIGNVVKLGKMPSDAFAPALQRAHGMGREQRWILTGNIPRAYSDVRRFGRIIFFLPVMYSQTKTVCFIGNPN
jgi:hypothetical protein